MHCSRASPYVVLENTKDPRTKEINDTSIWIAQNGTVDRIAFDTHALNFQTKELKNRASACKQTLAVPFGPSGVVIFLKKSEDIDYDNLVAFAFDVARDTWTPVRNFGIEGDRFQLVMDREGVSAYSKVIPETMGTCGQSPCVSDKGTPMRRVSYDTLGLWRRGNSEITSRQRWIRNERGGCFQSKACSNPGKISIAHFIMT